MKRHIVHILYLFAIPVGAQTLHQTDGRVWRADNVMDDGSEGKGSEAKDSEIRAAEDAQAGAQSSLLFEIVATKEYNTYTAIFSGVPVGLEAQLSRNAVNARGAQFVVCAGPTPGTVLSTFYSSDPAATAAAIAQRLTARVLDPSPPGAEECAVM